VEDQDGADDGGSGASDGAEMRANFEAGEQAQKDNDWKSGD
jgi:hypothetical protein